MGSRIYKTKEAMTPEELFAQEEAKLEAELVRYVVELNGKVVVVENVPARVNSETGEQLLSAETINRLQQLLASPAPPTRYVDTAVYTFAA